LMQSIITYGQFTSFHIYIFYYIFVSKNIKTHPIERERERDCPVKEDDKYMSHVPYASAVKNIIMIRRFMHSLSKEH
ncbi:hypothetical protein ACJX0J_017880, partial [Zea mays]